MDIITSWVKPPNAIGGLDHLAVQAPCISLYGKMLPGITNVTDRARYYSFYPWVVWSLEKNGLRYGDTFIDLFRKYDTADGNERTGEKNLCLSNVFVPKRNKTMILFLLCLWCEW